jgi:hypothetical protein
LMEPRKVSYTCSAWPDGSMSRAKKCRTFYTAQNQKGTELSPH